MENIQLNRIEQMLHECKDVQQKQSSQIDQIVKSIGGDKELNSPGLAERQLLLEKRVDANYNKLSEDLNWIKIKVFGFATLAAGLVQALIAYFKQSGGQGPHTP